MFFLYFIVHSLSLTLSLLSISFFDVYEIFFVWHGLQLGMLTEKWEHRSKISNSEYWVRILFKNFERFKFLAIHLGISIFLLLKEKRVPYCSHPFFLAFFSSRTYPPPVISSLTDRFKNKNFSIKHQNTEKVVFFLEIPLKISKFNGSNMDPISDHWNW